MPCRQRFQDALAVSHGLRGGGDGRAQVGHDDGAGELSGGVGQHRSHQRVVAQVQMPIVGAGEGELLHGKIPANLNGRNCNAIPLVVLVLGVSERIAREDAPHYHEEHWDEEHRQHSRGDHASHHPRTDGVAAVRAGSGGDGQRQHA